MIFEIWKKEIKSLFLSPGLYVVFSLCASLFSWRFLINLQYFAQNYQNQVFQLGQANYSMHIHFGLFAGHLSYLNLVFILFTPVLTMKLLAEEKRSGSLKLLFSSPISSWQIIGGKYLAAVTLMFCVLLLSFLFPLICVFFAEVDWILLLGSYFGMFLLGCLYVGIGIFSSSLGSSVMVSLILGIFLNVMVWFLGVNAEMADSQWIREALQHLSLNYHISGMIQGVFHLSAVVFFASLTGLFLLLSETFLQFLKWK